MNELSLVSETLMFREPPPPPWRARPAAGPNIAAALLLLLLLLGSSGPGELDVGRKSMALLASSRFRAFASKRWQQRSAPRYERRPSQPSANKLTHSQSLARWLLEQMGGFDSFFSAPAPTPPSSVPFHAKLASAAKTTGGHLGRAAGATASAASAVHAHGTKATSAVAKAVSSGGGPVPVPDTPPPPTCGAIEASVSYT